MKLATTFAGLTLAIAAAYSMPAVAQTYHVNSSQPMARCMPSTAEFGARLWARPLAIDNTSTQVSWVTCGFEFDSGAAIDYSALMVDTYFTNNSNVDATVTCSGVAGYAGDVTENISLSVTIPAGSGGEDGNLYWMDTDFETGSMETGLVAINCRLPAGVGINDSYVHWATE